jgi:hypothetical protein
MDNLYFNHPNKEKSAMAKLGGYGSRERGRTEGWLSVLGIVEMQRQFAASCIAPLLLLPAAMGIIMWLAKYTDVNDVLYDPKFTLTTSFGLKRPSAFD